MGQGHHTLRSISDPVYFLSKAQMSLTTWHHTEWSYAIVSVPQLCLMLSGLNLRAASCCFTREGLASHHIYCVHEFNSCGVTEDSETH